MIIDKIFMNHYCIIIMINHNYAADSRICERIKFDQALYILTMYEKKIRKSHKEIQNAEIVDADAEMQDIISSWKSKWKMDLTKPILNCVTSVHPRILIDLQQQEIPQLDHYYTCVNKFLTRFRTQHQDQTNFKMVIQPYDRMLEYQSIDKYEASAKAVVKGFLMMARTLSERMIEKIMSNWDLVTDNMMDVNTETQEWKVLGPLKYVREIARRCLMGDEEQMEAENDVEPKHILSRNLVTFATNVAKTMEKIKQSEHGSTLVTVQPKIDELTELIHPLLMAVGTNFKKESHEKTKDYEWGKIQVDHIPMMETIKNSYNYSKVAFINLDGYESQFNLEFVRNFKKHLLYVSFPKEEAKLDHNNEIFTKRFFKKMMFKYSQKLYETFSDNYMSQDYKTLTMMQRLNFNPQQYHTLTEKLYEQKNDKLSEDFNQNMYIFPIRMKILRQKFKEILQTKEDIENHESHFIRFIIRDFLLSQIREFNPTLIMISYSGRLHIQDQHFVEIMQQFTKIANYKVLFFPNFTTSFLQVDDIQIQDAQGEPCEYDNRINDPKIRALLAMDQMIEQGPQLNQHWLQLFNKIARFLKVSSGTYNLNRVTGEEPLVNKYKNQFIMKYVDEIMTVMGKEYPSIQKIRFKNKDLSILPKLFEDNIKSIKKTFQHTISKLYFDIYDMIQYLLFDRQNKQIPKRQELLKQYRLIVEKYQELLDQLRDNIQSKSDYQVSVVTLQTMAEDLISKKQQEKYFKMKEVFNMLKESHLFQLCSEKFEEKTNIYFKTSQENEQFKSVVQQTQSIKGLYETTFYLTGKINLKIYESTKILYKINQVNRRAQKVPVLIMNNITDGTSENSFQNYYSQIDIGSGSKNADKRTFEQKKCLATPIVFESEQGQKQIDSKVQVLAQWNYHQTQYYILLFWPCKYDFLQAFLLKLMNKPYRPPIVNDIYFCRKGSKNIVFRRANLYSQHRIAPRMGTSCYDTQGKVYIFGGFYQGDKNYLQLQHDIVSLDIQTFQQNGHNKLVLQNIKQQLYSSMTFDSRMARKEKPNSFVRPRMEFQFFQRNQLVEGGNEIQEDNVKTVIMMGGYGQNFMRPYSLLTYYYYTLKFRVAQRLLQSVQKRIIYNKAVPINTRQMTKNLGVIKTNKKTKNSLLQTNKFSDADSHTLYRNTFKIDIKDGQQDFNYKVKYMFSEQEYQNYKHEIKKIQELKNQQFDSSPISLERDPTTNHRIIIDKDGKKKQVALRMEIPPERAKKLQGMPKQVPLTHESIICLDVYSTMICAIVKHDKYTQGKSVLVESNTKGLQNLNFEQDIVNSITLTYVKQFDCDLSLHILIICNKNTTAILHGEKICESTAPQQFILKRKKNKNQISCFQIKQREHILRKNQTTELVTSVFFRHQHKILSIEFISLSSSRKFHIICQQIQLNSANDQYRWIMSNVDRFDPSIQYEIMISGQRFIKLEQVRFVQFLKSHNLNYLAVQFDRIKYGCQVSRYNKCLELMDQGKLKIERESMQKGLILTKTQQMYIDRQYI